MTKEQKIIRAQVGLLELANGPSFLTQSFKLHRSSRPPFDGFRLLAVALRTIIERRTRFGRRAKLVQKLRARVPFFASRGPFGVSPTPTNAIEALNAKLRAVGSKVIFR